MSEERKMTRYRMEGAVLAVADDNGGWVPIAEALPLADENARLREALSGMLRIVESLDSEDDSKEDIDPEEWDGIMAAARSAMLPAAQGR